MVSINIKNKNLHDATTYNDSGVAYYNKGEYDRVFILMPFVSTLLNASRTASSGVSPAPPQPLKEGNSATQENMPSSDSKVFIVTL